MPLSYNRYQLFDNKLSPNLVYYSQNEQYDGLPPSFNDADYDVAADDPTLVDMVLDYLTPERWNAWPDDMIVSFSFSLDPGNEALTKYAWWMQVVPESLRTSLMERGCIAPSDPGLQYPLEDLYSAMQEKRPGADSLWNSIEDAIKSTFDFLGEMADRVVVARAPNGRPWTMSDFLAFEQDDRRLLNPDYFCFVIGSMLIPRYVVPDWLLIEDRHRVYTPDCTHFIAEDGVWRRASGEQMRTQREIELGNDPSPEQWVAKLVSFALTTPALFKCSHWAPVDAYASDFRPFYTLYSTEDQQRFAHPVISFIASRMALLAPYNPSWIPQLIQAKRRKIKRH